MPQLGETVAEGKIVKWFKSAGDAVKPGENLFEIETDKTSMEVPATSAGTLTWKSDFRSARWPRSAPWWRSSAAPARPQARLPPRTAKVPAAAPARGRRAGDRDAGRADAAHGTARSVPRSAHARAQFWAGEACEWDIHHAVGAAARRRTRHRSLARHRLRPARPHRRPRRRTGGACRARHGHRRQRFAGQGALRRHRLRRSAARRRCGAPSPSGWSRPSRPSRISI